MQSHAVTRRRKMPPPRRRWLGAVVLLTVFGAAALLSAQPAKVFTNMQGLVHCRQGSIVSVHSTSEVTAAIQEARQAGLHVKAAINGWAGSNDNSCVGSGGLQLETASLNQILAVDTDKAQVRVQPGIKLWDFNEKMHTDYGLVLPVVQEYAEVTLGGMLGNATHGSSLGAPSSSIVDSVVAVTLVDGRGEVRVITGKDLDYVAGNLGVLGIITEITLQLQPSFKVQATLADYDDANLDADILDLATADYAVNLTWFPGQHKYVTATFRKVASDTPGEAHNGQTETDWFSRTLFPLIFKFGNAVPGNELTCLLGKPTLPAEDEKLLHRKLR